MKQRIYIDTSIIGGCLDEEFKEASKKLVEKFKRGDMIAVVSESTVLELRDAPEEVQKVFREIPEENIEYAELKAEAVNLAQKYISEKVLGRGKLVDAEHIALLL